ncbi:MAG: hypothetical protein OHK0012_15410 [Synechococcales cyanobacterium]
MPILHVALSTTDLKAAIADYSARLGSAPVVVVPDTYALWRTPHVNLSLRWDPDRPAGQLRHLGWEDDTATAFTVDIDVHGIPWERFHPLHQAAEIQEVWPGTDYPVADIG